MNNDYQDIIHGLRGLQSVRPNFEFRTRMKELALPDHAPVFFFSVARIAIVLIALLLLGGAGVVVASTQSNPGDLLYPIKKVVEQAKTHFSQPPEPEINPKSKTINMHVDSIPVQNQEVQPSPSLPVSNQSINAELSAAPTQVPLSTPTPTQLPTQQQEIQIPQVNAAVATPILPVNVDISIGSPPAPTPTPTIAGSKDLNNGAGNASLLPNIQVNIPLPPVHLGL